MFKGIDGLSQSLQCDHEILLSEVIARAAVRMKAIGQRFLVGCRNLLQGNLSAADALTDCVGMALDGYGGIICTPLHYMKFFDPGLSDEQGLSAIRQGINDLLEGVFSLCAAVGIPRDHLRRFRIRHDSVFTTGFFGHHRPRFLEGKAERLSAYRVRLIEHICATVRAFWAWLRVLIGEALSVVSRRVEAVSDVRRLEPRPALRELVALADQTLGLVVLQGENGEAMESFKIGRGRQGAWSVIRLLVEECDENGCVRLAKTYGSHFQTKDAAGDTLNDDLARLYRHIISVGGGRYRLSRTVKAPLLRDQ